MRVFIGLIVVFGGTSLYFYLNPSYRLSMEAKFYYSMGDYEIALQLSEEALKLREYNTMAFHIKTRSELTLQMVDFIKEADEFKKEIIKIFTQGKPSRKNKLRIKMMSDIVVDKYKNLSLKFIEDEELKKEALLRYQQFKKLNKDIKSSLQEERDEQR